MHESRSFKIFRVVLLTVLVVFTVLPMYTMISTSIKPLADGQKASAGRDPRYRRGLGVFLHARPG
jgi:ABC-type glycerol-3-phosphate transport system permease component